MDLLDKTRTEKVYFYFFNRKIEILKIHNPSRGLLSSIMTKGSREFLILERMFSFDDQLSIFPYEYHTLIVAIVKKFCPVNIEAVKSFIGFFIKRGALLTIEYCKRVLQQQLRSYSKEISSYGLVIPARLHPF